jgi:hypothetical protein
MQAQQRRTVIKAGVVIIKEISTRIFDAKSQLPWKKGHKLQYRAATSSNDKW